jgi:serine/threonine protein kinase/tetratricopeptide (TPR) repeat protein
MTEHDNDNTRTHVVLTKGTMVSHYRIVEKIGAGGMGEVYLAQDTELDRKVALKFLPSHLCQDNDCRKRFKREAQAAAKLDHPNIVTIYEVGEHQGRPFFAMQHVEGRSLRDVIKGKELTPDQAINLAAQICEGLNKAHQAGVIHRDIKPSNIVIDTDGRAKLLDFGLATVAGTDKLTRTGSTLGTVGYMSPEQASGRKTDECSDLFSLGVVLYEMITGRRPFKGEDEAATLHAVTHESPEPLARFKAEIPDGLQDVVDRALDKDVETRYPTAAAMLADLRRLRRRSSDTVELTKPGRRFGPLAVAIIALCAVVIVVAGYLIIDQTLVSEVPGKDGWTNSIAVLPFRDFSPNKDQEYFCDGMTDALIGRLSGIEGLKVISMTSVMRYKTPDRDLRKIGRDLQVKVILEGSIQREDSRIRVRSQLINVADDAHIWSQTYNRELKSVFDIQDDISRAIVDAMRIELFGKDEAVITRRYTQNIEAYNYYSRGRHLWNKMTERDIRKAIEYFEKAIELDPNYALAYSGLADAWTLIWRYVDVYRSVTKAEALPKAKEAAQMAIELDEGLAEAHASLGLVLRYKPDPEGAEKEFLRAIELNPGYFSAHFMYSLLLRDMANYPGQIREEDIAFELNPMSIPLINNRAFRKRQSFEWQEAEELYQRLIEIEPNRWQSYTTYAYLLAKSMGRNEDAIRQCSLAVQIDKRAYNDLAYIYEWTGDLEKALWAANKYVESTPDKHNAYDTRGTIYALNGMLDSAIASFQKALEIKPDFVSSLRKLGNMHMFRQEYAKAESLYQVLASHPDKEIRANGRLYLTQIPVHQGKFRKALRMLDELKDKALADSLQGFYQTYGTFKRGVIYQEYLDDPESAISEFEKAAETLKEIEPNSFLVAFSRGAIAYSHTLSGDLDRADQLLRELERDIEDYGPTALRGYWFCVGLIELRKGNFDAAVVHLEKLVRLNPMFWNRFHLGEGYLGAGRLDDAIAVFEKIINRYEQSLADFPAKGVLTHYYLGRAYEEAGRYSDAIAQYETFLDIWKNADEGLKMVVDAKERLARLKAGRE